MSKKPAIIKLCSPLFLAILLTAGCAKKTIIADEAIIRYQKVQIPNYKKSDYEELLTSENAEVKYNAICNLIEHASDYARSLDKGIPKVSSPDSKSQTEGQDKNAKKVFHAITKELDNKNESIKTVSLIFITEFSSSYSNKEELLRLVTQVKTENIRTQYEQIRALAKLSNSETRIDKNLIGSFLDSRSWLIKSMTYLLLGKISSEEFHMRLIKEYKNTNEEYNKLLIIHAFSEAYGPEVFHLIKTELLSSDSERMRSKIISILKNNSDKKIVAKWIIRDHKTIDKETLQTILGEYYPELASAVGAIFFHDLLSSNQEQLIDMIDQKNFFKGLYNSLENQVQPNELVELEIAVQNINYLNHAWAVYKDHRDKERLKEKEKRIREEEFERTVLPKYNAMLKRFLEDSKKLFADAGMDKDEIEDATKSIEEFLQILDKDTSK
jgi:hypothetical protein